MSKAARSPASDLSCRICGGKAGPTFSAREMLNGTREAFDYFECAACGCVQIAEVPRDLGRFYPPGYFSFRPLGGLDRNFARRLIDPHRVRRAFGARDRIGAVADAVSRPLDYVAWLKEAGLGPDAAVLDVGCGQGKTLLVMALGGMRPCDGVDPFIAETIRYRSGATVHKTELADYAAAAPRRYDLVMFHHALEHVVDPLAALRAAANLLAPAGRILVVVPVADSEAFARYRETWCNLDAPRHLHLLTSKSMAILATGAGLAVVSARSVGNPSQFSGSERYRRDIPACDARRDRDLFSVGERRDFAALSARLNAEGRGDQTRFILAPAASAA